MLVYQIIPVIIELPYFFTYKPISAISRDPDFQGLYARLKLPKKKGKTIGYKPSTFLWKTFPSGSSENVPWAYKVFTFFREKRPVSLCSNSYFALRLFAKNFFKKARRFRNKKIIFFRFIHPGVGAKYEQIIKYWNWSMCIDTDYVRESSVYCLNSSCKEINSTDTLFNCYYEKCNMKSTLLLTCLHHKPVSCFS